MSGLREEMSKLDRNLIAKISSLSNQMVKADTNLDKRLAKIENSSSSLDRKVKAAAFVWPEFAVKGKGLADVKGWGKIKIPEGVSVVTFPFLYPVLPKETKKAPSPMKK